MVAKQPRGHGNSAHIVVVYIGMRCVKPNYIWTSWFQSKFNSNEMKQRFQKTLAEIKIK